MNGLISAQRLLLDKSLMGLNVERDLCGVFYQILINDLLA